MEIAIGQEDKSSLSQIGILASQMCLALQRFLGNPDYKMPGRQVLDEAIAFFEQGQREMSSNSNGHSGSLSKPSALVSKALATAEIEDNLLRGITPRQFADSAITSLQWLADSPWKVPEIEKKRLSTFFISLERIAGKSAAFASS